MDGGLAAEGAARQVEMQPDSVLTGFVDGLVQNTLEVRQMDSAKLAIPETERQALELAYRATIDQLAAGIGLGDGFAADTTKPAAERLDSAYVKVDAFLERAAISMLIYPVAIGITVALVGVTIFVSILWAWAIYRVSPKEVRVHNQSMYCPAHRRARQLAGILLPIAIASFFVLLMSGAGIGWGLMVAGVLMLPIGIAGLIFDRQVTRKDTDISTFLRSLGNVASAIGITVSNALDRVDHRSTAKLSGDVKRLRNRLVSRLKPELCWQRFSVETGSETIYGSVKMFHDATRLGGDPEEVAGRFVTVLRERGGVL